MSKLSRQYRRLRQGVQEAFGATYELDGARFTLPSWADDIKRNIKRGHYEAAERRLVLQHLRSDLPVVELGGSFGIVSGVIARRLAPTTPHIIVEANPLLTDYCRANATAPRGSGAPVTVINAAIAYGVGAEVSFLQSGGFLGSRLALDGDSGTIRVPALRLSALLAQHVPGQDYQLVCDIEGGELDMLIHDRDALQPCRSAMVEMHADVFAARGTSEAGFITLLEAADLSVRERVDNVVFAAREVRE